MTRLFFALVITLGAAAGLHISSASASDDGGFGTQRFSQQSPAALSDGSGDADLAAFGNPALIEPAAGEDATALPQDVLAFNKAEAEDKAVDQYFAKLNKTGADR